MLRSAAAGMISIGGRAEPFCLGLEDYYVGDAEKKG